MNKQMILYTSEDYAELDIYLKENDIKKFILVCDKSLPFLRINKYFNSLTARTGIKFVKFDNFSPNPLYESVVEGVNLFHYENCEAIIAVGGGSAIDVAKCIKLYSNMDPSKNYLEQVIRANAIKFLAVPTTAGTGSEATRYAVIYYGGEKQSISSDSCIPSAVLFDPSVLKTLPDYQKKSTMMDALCHAIESYWSINSNDESQRYSKKAIEIILASKDSYLANEDTGNITMLKAANLAGKAINITQTTAAHAMCYKLTGLYGIAHGHAVALCMNKLFPYMAENLDQCTDPRGKRYLEEIFSKIAEALGCASVQEGNRKFSTILNELNLDSPKPGDGDYNILKKSVNPVRLKNNPIRLDENTIDMIYHKILERK